MSGEIVLAPVHLRLLREACEAYSVQLDGPQPFRAGCVRDVIGLFDGVEQCRVVVERKRLHVTVER